MTPLPKKRHSSERQGRRRAKIQYKPATLVKCDNCSYLKIPHQVCKNCGTYKGSVIVAPKIKTTVSRVVPENSEK